MAAPICILSRSHRAKLTRPAATVSPPPRYVELEAEGNRKVPMADGHTGQRPTAPPRGDFICPRLTPSSGAEKKFPLHTPVAPQLSVEADRTWLAAIGLGSALSALFSLQILTVLTGRIPDGQREEAEATRHHDFIVELGVSLCGFSLTFSLSSLLVSLTQLRLTLSGERECRQRTLSFYLRFLAFGGFFIGLPVLLAAAICLVSLRGGLVSLAVWSLFGTFGLLLSCLAIGQFLLNQLCRPVGAAEQSQSASMPNSSSSESEANLSTLV